MVKNEDGINKKRIIEETTKIDLPKAVVAPEFIEETIPLRDAWIGTLKDKRHISNAIKFLTKILPGMSYLKRCSGKRLLLGFVAPTDGEPMEKTEKFFSQKELEDLFNCNDSLERSFFEEEFEIIGVPARSPRTKAQAQSASKIWPINFHPDPYLEATLNGSCFDYKKLEIIDQCMKLCIEAAAREAYGNEECNGSAIIFDPIEGEIIALAVSRIDRHPLWHAAMLAIDLVARLGNGRTDGNTGGVYELNNDCANRKRKYMQHNEEPPLVYPNSLRDIVPRVSLSLNSKESSNSSGSEVAKTERQRTDSAYLCTNYWVFLLREPCALCAMALVHSRVSEIFYGAKNEIRGVLGSRTLLHAIPGLNHRYRVWRGIREKECHETCIEISNRL